MSVQLSVYLNATVASGLVRVKVNNVGLNFRACLLSVTCDAFSTYLLTRTTHSFTVGERPVWYNSTHAYRMPLVACSKGTVLHRLRSHGWFRSARSLVFEAASYFQSSELAVNFVNDLERWLHMRKSDKSSMEWAHRNQPVELNWFWLNPGFLVRAKWSAPWRSKSIQGDQWSGNDLQWIKLICSSPVQFSTT